MRKALHALTLFALFNLLGTPHQGRVHAGGVIHAPAQRDYQSIPDTAFKKRFKEYLCQRLGKAQSEIIISRFKVLGNKPVPPGDVQFRIYHKERGPLMGYVRLVAIVKVDGMGVNEVKLSGWADVFESVVCTRRDLRKGESIGKDDVYLAPKNISRLGSNILRDMRKAMGQMAKHNIRINTCLTEEMLETPPAVERGDLVTIVADSGSLTVTVPGSVLTKGCPGEIVSIQNTMSKKKIYARVINDSTVMVDF